ncbi:MAG: D-alanine--D-alanine ligase [Alphaproteobacteria bacterium]|nr:D-alanine--D-alanine ligase [Alphaproteobacteria bacterium]
MNTNKKYNKVGVLMGGMSSEREVSFSSGKNVVEALKEAGYDAFGIELTPDIEKLVKEINEKKPEVIFNALHGKFGEDGCIQGLLDLMQIPYTHSGRLASALAMNKATAKAVYKQAGIPVAKDKIVSKNDILNDNVLPRPYITKPLSDGSSVGVYIFNKDDKKKPFEGEKYPYAENEEILAEEYIPGREMTVAVLDGKALGVLEIKPSVDWYDYTAKYTNGGAVHECPAKMPKEDYEKMMEYAVKAHNALGCRGVSRSDFRYDDTDKSKPARIIILETNTQPGMTSLSLVPDIAKSIGISYPELVSILVETAKCGN